MSPPPSFPDYKTSTLSVVLLLSGCGGQTDSRDPRADEAEEANAGRTTEQNAGRTTEPNGGSAGGAKPGSIVTSSAGG